MPESDYKRLDEERAKQVLSHYKQNYLHPIDESADPRVWYGPGDKLFRISLGGKLHHLNRSSLLQFYVALRDCMFNEALASQEGVETLVQTVVPATQPHCVLCKKSLTTCQCVMGTLHKRVLETVGEGDNASVEHFRGVLVLVNAFIAQHSLAITSLDPIAKFLRVYQDYVTGSCEKWEFLSALAELE